jgi:hypothetical protein
MQGVDVRVRNPLRTDRETWFVYCRLTSNAIPGSGASRLCVCRFYPSSRCSNGHKPMPGESADGWPYIFARVDGLGRRYLEFAFSIG